MVQVGACAIIFVGARLGFEADVLLLQHSYKRLIYYLTLPSNPSSYLCGVDSYLSLTIYHLTDWLLTGRKSSRFQLGKRILKAIFDTISFRKENFNNLTSICDC